VPSDFAFEVRSPLPTTERQNPGSPLLFYKYRTAVFFWPPGNVIVTWCTAIG